MPWSCYLASDGALLGYGAVEDGAADGPVDRSTMSDVPAGAMTRTIRPIKPDLPTDGTYFWDQPSQAFMHQSARVLRVQSQDQSDLNELMIRTAQGEDANVVLKEIAARRIFAPGALT